MINTVVIMPCTFVNSKKFINDTNDDTTYGYRMYDSYAMTHNNLWEEKDLYLSPTEILKKVYNDGESDDTIYEMLDFIVDNKLGIYIGDVWLEWEQISEVLT